MPSSSLPQPTVMEAEQNKSRTNANDQINEQSSNKKNIDEKNGSTIDSKNVNSSKGTENDSSSSKFPVKIQFIDNRRGRGVIATRSFTAKECVLATVPTISVLYSSHANKLCAYCFHEIVDTHAEIITVSESINNVDEPQEHLTNSKTEHDDNKGNEHDGVYRCPTCDQFVLCARCVELALHGKLSEFEENTDSANAENNVHDNDVLVKSVSTDTNALSENTSSKNSKEANLTDENTTRKLENTFVVKVHNLACSWYNELPLSVRAPGQDTDMLRFCLQYGARVYYNDTEMQHEMMALDSNESALSLSTRQFCEIFARDRIVATFSAPYQCHSLHKHHHHHQHEHENQNAEPSIDKLEADQTSHELSHDIKNEKNVTGSANSSDTHTTITSVNTSNTHVNTSLPSTIVDCADTSSLHFIRYPVL